MKKFGLDPEVDKDTLSYLEWCAQKYLSYRPRSESEVRRYLLEKIKKRHEEKLPEADKYIEIVVEKLVEDKTLDDNAFIDWWVQDRTYFKPRGTISLKSELAQKGVPRETLEDYFEENPVDEEELLKRILLKKLARIDLTSEKERNRLTAFLMRRGFCMSQIKKAIEESAMQE